MPNKNLCNKCNKKHFPPTGKRCKYLKKGLVSVDSDINVMPQGGVPVETHSETDINAMPHSGVPVTQSKKSKNVCDSLCDSSSSDDEPSVQLQILQELKRVNTRLNAVEDQIAEGESSRRQKRKHRPDELSKLSSKNLVKLSSKKLAKTVSHTSESDSSPDSDCNVPSLSALKSSSSIQHQIDERLRELEVLPEDTGVGFKGKLKSKRGGPVDVLVKHKIAWPHEAILGGVNRTRVTYDQLTLSQWVQGFCKNILDESDNRKREKMIAYMADLMEDTTDFTWQGAKGAHAVLCCELERGTLTWDDSERIDRIRRAHAQKHPASNNKTWSKTSEASKRPWFCKFFQNGSCSFDKDHEMGGKLQRHICARCVQQGRVLSHAEKDCYAVKKQQNSKNE